MKKLTKLRDAGYTNDDAAIASISETTALVNHTVAKGHTFGLVIPKIIDRSLKTSSLPILESCDIKNT